MRQCALLFALVLAAVVPGISSVIALSTDYSISWSGPVGVSVTDGSAYTADSGQSLLDPGLPAWMFTAPAQGVVLRVLDLVNDGDQFNVLDFGTQIGVTSVPANDNANCSTNIAECLSNPKWTKGYFNLAAGDHALTFTLAAEASAYPFGIATFRVDPTSADSAPEPGSLILLALGICALLVYHRRACAYVCCFRRKS